MKHSYHSNTATLSLPHLLSDFRKLFLLTACLLLMHGMYAQDFVWAKSMGGTSFDQSNSIAVDASGNVYTTGYFQGTVDFDPGPATYNLTSSGFKDIFVSKLDAAGNLIWAKSMGGGSNQIGNSIVVDASGNVYITGYFSGMADFDPGAATYNLTSTGANDIFVSKLDANGNFTWAKSFRGSTNTRAFGNGIAVDASGNVYTSGSLEGSADFDPGAVGIDSLISAGNFDIFVSKLDAGGNYIWAKSMGGSARDVGYGIALDALGNAYTTGYFEGTVDFDPGAAIVNLVSAGDRDIFVSKLDASGNFVWAKNIGGASNDEGLGIAVDASGNVHTTGYFQGTADFDPGAGTANLVSGGDRDIFVSKLDAVGNFIWAKNMGGASNDEGLGITVDVSGNVYTTGSFQGTADFDPGAGTANLNGAGSNDIFVLKLDAAGNFCWAKNMGGAFPDEGRGIAVDASGNVYTTGSFGGTADFDPGAGTTNLASAGASDIFVLKLDAPTVAIAAPTTTPYEICESESVPAGDGLTANCFCPSPTLLDEDFESGSGALTVSGGTISSNCFTGGSGSWAHMTSDQGIAREIRTGAFDLSTAGASYSMDFTYLRSETSGPSGCNKPESNDLVTLEYSINGGTNWILIVDLTLSPSGTDFNTAIPAGALTSATLFRWYQDAHDTFTPDGSGSDNWGLDDVSLGSTTPCTSGTNWYTSASGGTPVASGSVFDPTSIPVANGGVDASTPGVTTYYATCTAFGCEGPRTPATFTVLELPILDPNLDATICSDVASGIILAVAPGSVPERHYNIVSITVASGLAPAAGNGVVGDDQDENVIAGDIFTNTTGGPLTVEYEVSPVGLAGCGCRGDTVTVTLSVNPEPVLTSNLADTVCSGQPTNLLLTTANSLLNTVFTWSPQSLPSGISLVSSSSPGTVIADVLTNNTGAPVDVIYHVTAQQGNCSSAPATVTLRVVPFPAVSPTASLDACQDILTPGQAVFNLNILDASIGNGLTVNYFSDPNLLNPITGSSSFLSGTTTVYGSVVNPGSACPDRTDISLTVVSIAQPIISRMAFPCSNTSQLLAPSRIIGISFNFYDADPDQGGLLLGSGASYDPMLITGQSQTFWVTATDGFCESEPVSVTVTVRPAPEADIRRFMQEPFNEVCVGTEARFVTTPSPSGTPAVTMYDWTFSGSPTLADYGQIIAAGNANNQGATYAAGDVGAQTVDLTITYDNGCTSMAPQHTITVNPLPSAPNRTINRCDGDDVAFNLQNHVNNRGNGLNSNFSWQANAVTGVTGMSTTAQTGDVINDVLVNTTLVNKIVVYTVTPTSDPQGCVGPDFRIRVRLRPSTRIQMLPIDICPGDQVNVAQVVRDYSLLAVRVNFYDADPNGPGANQIGTSRMFRGIARTTDKVFVSPTVTTTYWVTGLTANGCEQTLSFDVTVLTNCNALIAPVAMLEGAFDITTSQQRTQLQQNALVPTAEPYTGLGYNFNGGGNERMNLSATMTAGIVDWVIVELRDATDPTYIVHSRAALLLDNGQIVDMDGVSQVAVTAVPNGRYYVAIIHRNHLGVMTAQPVSMGTTVDFTDTNLAMYGSTNTRVVKNGKALLFAGDADGNGQVQNTDDVMEWSPNAGGSGYQQADYNLDGQVQNTDRVLIWTRNVGRGTAVPK